MRIQSPRALKKTNNPHQCDNPPNGKDHAASVCARRRPLRYYDHVRGQVCDAKGG